MWLLRSVEQTLAVHSNTFVAACDPLEAHSILIGHLPRGPAECQTGELAAVLDRFQGGTCNDSKEPCNTSMASCFGRIVERSLAVHSNTFVVASDPLEAHSTQTGHLPQGPAESQTGVSTAVLDMCQDGTCQDHKGRCNASKASCCSQHCIVGHTRSDDARYASSRLVALLRYFSLVVAWLGRISLSEVSPHQHQRPFLASSATTFQQAGPATRA